MPWGESKSSITRSRSFGGFLNKGGQSSTPHLASFGSPPLLGVAASGKKASPGGSIGAVGGGLSFAWRKSKAPKVPRPQRALLIFQHAMLGVRECLAATDADIEKMRAEEALATSSTGQARVIGLEKQVKAAERYKKKLEFHLSKIEELEEHYKLHQQLREGVKTMAKAYESQHGTPSKSSLSSVRAGYKECSQVMCAVEAQLEGMLGSFHCQMQGLIGFARMVPGDVYEVVIRHGTQKWKCRGRIGLTQQTWDSDAFTFKALVGDVLNIKACEIRSLSSVALGHKNCEVKDLFSSHPQLMTVSLNATATIKLKLLCTWNPLDGVDESIYSPLNSVAARVSAARPRPHSMYVGSGSMWDLGSTGLFSPTSSLVPVTPPRQTALLDTNFKMASFMSPITNPSRNYAVPDYNQPIGASSRPKSIAVSGGLESLSSPETKHERPRPRSEIFESNPHATFDLVADLGRDLGNYTPKSYGKGAGGQEPDKHNPLSFSDRDLSLYTPRAHSWLENPHYDIYLPPTRPLSSRQSGSHYSPPLCAREDRQMSPRSPEGGGVESETNQYGSQPHLTSVVTAVSPQYSAGHARSPYVSTPPEDTRTPPQSEAQRQRPKSAHVTSPPRPFSYIENSRSDTAYPGTPPPRSQHNPASPPAYHHNHSPRPHPRSPSPPSYYHPLLHSGTPQTGAAVFHGSSPKHSTAPVAPSRRDTDENNLEAVMTQFKRALEEYVGQYSELSGLDEQVHYLDRLLKKNSCEYSPRSEDGGISIEDALNAFDFLESADEEFIDGYAAPAGTATSTGGELEHLEGLTASLSPESTARTSDSGIECLAARLNDHHRQPQSAGGTPAHRRGVGATTRSVAECAATPGGARTAMATTGNAQVDRVLIWHLTYCRCLLRHLGSTGVLQCREKRALGKLRKQAEIIEHLVQLAKKHPGNIKDLQSVLSSLTKDKALKKLWVLCTDSDVLFTSQQRFLLQMDKSYGDILKRKADISPSLVFRCLLSRVLDLPNVDPQVYCPESILTLHQLMHHLAGYERTHVPDVLLKIAGELWITRGLKCEQSDTVLKTLLTLKATLPPPECLRSSLILLLSDRPNIRQAAASYLDSINHKSGLRKQAVQVLVEALEEPSAELRSGACLGLKILEARECLRELTQLSLEDQSLLVQQRAREALFSFGEEGRQAFYDSQLESQGFQGVTMYL